MEGSGTTERVDREVSGVEALLDRALADEGGGGVGVHLDDAGRRVLDRQAEAVGEAPDRGVRGLDVEGHAPSEERLGIEQPEHHVGVGHGRFAALPVARRPRVGPRRTRPDPQATALLVDVGDRSAAARDRPQVEVCRVERVLLEDLLTRQGRLAIDDQADLERRASHVGRDDVAVRRAAGDGGGPGETAGRAGADRVERSAHRVHDGDDAAARLRDVERGAQPMAGETVREVLQVAVGCRADVAVDHGGDGALELALAWRDLPRQADEHVRCESRGRGRAAGSRGPGWRSTTAARSRRPRRRRRRGRRRARHAPRPRPAGRAWRRPA